MSEYEKTAKRIADVIRNRDDGMVIVDRQFEQLEHDIEDALTAAVAAERENQKALRDHALTALAEKHHDELAAERAKWKAFADEKGEPIPVGLHRFDDDDEAVGFGWFHLERMHDGAIWMSLGAPDNHLHIVTKNSRAKLRFFANDKLTLAAQTASLTELLELPIDGETPEQTRSRVQQMRGNAAQTKEPPHA